MTYAPVNIPAYVASYSGAIAGMGVSGWIVDPTLGSYEEVTEIAGAFAQAFDIAWNDATQLNNLEIAGITAIVSKEFAERGPGPFNNPAFHSVANWGQSARACIALVLQSDAYFAGQGIDPGIPITGTGYETVEVNGTPIAQESTLNIVGLNIIGSDVADVTTVTFQGGLKTVSTIAARNAITAVPSLCKEGMLVYVEALKVTYQLNEDLATWSFYDASLELQEQDTWEVNEVTGSDTNTGLAGNPLATSEELCRRLNPKGIDYVPRALTTNINFAAGTYGALILKGHFPEDVGLYGAVVFFNFETAHSAPITLSAVVNTNTTTKVRGQVTTIGATPFVANRRIRVISGASAGAVAYSLGQNASPSNHFVSEWWNYDSNAIQTVAPGSIVQTETCLVSFTRVSVELEGPGYWQFNSPIVHGDSEWITTSAGGTIDVVGGEFYGDTFAGQSGLWSTYLLLANCNFVQGEVYFVGTGFPSLYGCVVQSGAAISCYSGIDLELYHGNALNGGRVVAHEGGRIILRNNVEVENGGAVAAFTASDGSYISQRSGRLWGNSSVYATGINITSGSWFKTANVTTSLPDFPCTIQISATGQTKLFADIPFVIDRALCGAIIESDTTAPVASQAPFKGTYFIDPAFTGTQLGSSTNPFTTAAACFALAVTLGVTAGTIELAPGSTLVENITFPTTGEWEILSKPGQGSTGNASITGNIVISSTASARRTLTNILVTGTVTGNCSAGTQRILFRSLNVTGAVTFTQSGAGVNRLAFGSWSGESFSGFGAANCFMQGGVSVAGTINGTGAVIFTSLSFTAGGCLVNCLLPPTTSLTGAGSATLYLFNCANTSGGPLAFVASGGGQLTLRPDGVTISEFFRLSTPFTGNVALVSMLGNRSSITTQISNVGVTPLAALVPPGLQVIEACLTLLTTNVAASGNAVLNVTYTDATGTLVTEAVTTTLNVAGAVGSKARGSLQYSHTGATSPSFSVTGITNATGLSYKCDVAIRQAS